MDLIKPTPAGDLPEAYQARLADRDWHNTRYVSLSFSRAENTTTRERVETYRLHTMDLASWRLVPVLLGVTEGGCDHDVCSLMTLNGIAAEYAREAGWPSSHAPDTALGLGGQLGLFDA